LSALPPPLLAAEAERLIAGECARPFDVARPPLARWSLLRRGARDHQLTMVEHHFVHDGWSLALFLRELAALYGAFAAGGSSPLAEPAVQLGDVAAWQRGWLRGGVLDRRLSYWRERLAGAPPVLELPADRPRPPRPSFRGRTQVLVLPPELVVEMRRASRRAGVTLFMTALAAFEALLARLTGREDLVVGSAVANRWPRETEGVIGMLVNAVVVRTDLGGDPPFTELQRRVRDAALGAFAHQDLPFERLVEALQPERDPARNPLFQVAFSFHDSPTPALAWPDLTAEIEYRTNDSAKFDLNVVGIPRADGSVLVEWEGSVDLFAPETVARLAARYRTLLAAAVADPARRLSALPLLTAEERRQVEAWSRGAPPRPAAPLAAAAPRSVQELVAARAAAAPEALAVAGGGAALTYGELEAQANRLARQLKNLGVGEESRVAVCLERSPELVTAVLATLKAGGAYLPLDPSHPPERLAFTLADARPAALLTTSRLRARLAGPGEVPVLSLDDPELAARLARESPAPLSYLADPEALAYVIYTSGSTGTPKGTELTHRGLLNLIGWHLGDFGLTPSDRTTLVASPAFDASVWEVWPALAAGASLHVPPEEARSSPPDLLAWLAAEGITVSFLPTPLAEACLAELEESAPPDGLALRVLLTGGDRLHRAPRAGLPCRLVNCYGPTESTVVATAGTVPPREEFSGADGPAAPPAIGRPIAGLEARVLDAHLRPAPAGVTGELYVGGLGLARGYLERPDLTAERFVPHPLAGESGDDAGAVEPGARLYRTGDLVRWRDDGAGGAELEFLGRSDQQVKVRGVRIELGEVEAALAAHPAVRDAVVAARPSPGGEDRLVAYLVPHAPAAAGAPQRALAAELRAHLAAKLPEAMLPAAWVALEALPLTAAGKVDRRALPEPAWEEAAPAGGEPLGLAEELLAAIWGQVLGTAAARREDSFFALGGHSLLATQVMSRVRSVFHVELPLRTLFERPTLAELAAAVEEELNAKAPAAPPALVAGPVTEDAPLSFAQERLWFLDSYGGDGAVYTVPEAWRLDGALEPAALAAALTALVRRHETLRTTFEGGARGVTQVVGVPRRVPLPVADLSGLPEAARAAEAERLAAAEARRPFDLAAEPLLRALLLRLAPARHDFLLALHHIATDGWSQVLLHRELGSLYAAARERRPHALPPLAIQYRDFARWQRDWLQGEALAAQVDFWRAALAGAPPLLALPTDRPRPAVQTFRGDDARLTLPAPLRAELEALSRRQGVTLFMTLLAAFDLLLARRAEREDVVVGTPIAGRNQEEVEGLVGFFVNTLALRAEVGAGATFAELLAGVRDGALAAFAHQDLPFEKLVEELAPQRDLSHPPLFQVLFALHQFGAGAGQAGPALPGVAVRRLPVEQRIAKFDLALHVEPESDGLAALARYNTDLFDAATVQRLLAHFRNLLAAAAAHPEARLDELEMLAPDERQQLLFGWNDTAAPFPADLCLHEPFEAQARVRPEALAVVSPHGALTYGELDRRAARLARRLVAAGVGPGDLVGVHLDRSPAMAEAVVGVLKAGAAYVPLESGWPAERIDWIVAAHGIAHLVTESARRAALGPAAAAVADTVCLDELAAEPAGAHETPLPRRAGPEDLAYIIFTSGSTGTPKGVMVRHAAAVNLVHWVNRRFAVGPEDRLLFVTALSFDLSVYDLFGTLAAGGTVRLATSEEVRDPQRLV
ncbi:MAG TPA: amino acid adenylation domain-containing protein, partial [Thermoanaerobaculia bacterium]